MITINLLQAYELLALQQELTDEEILHDVKTKKTSDWQALISDWPMEELTKLAADEAAFERALAGDYTIFYITLPGLTNLLTQRFGLVKDSDFKVTDTAITHLRLTEQQQQQIAQMLSSNWQMQQQEDGYTISM